MAEGSIALNKDQGSRVNLFWHDKSHVASKDTLKVTFTNDEGSNVIWDIGPIRVQSPLASRAWFRTTIACLAIAILFLLLLVLLPRSNVAASWLPLIAWLMSLLGSSGLTVADIAKWKIVPGYLVVTVFGLALATLVTGALSPRALKVLAPLKPFEFLALLALSIPWLRRRHLAPYAARVRERLATQSAQAQNEKFVRLPADTRSRGEREKTETVADPVKLILDVLTRDNVDQRASIFLESPGGRGKSALVRGVVAAALDQFLENPRKPLPILCDLGAKSIEEGLTAALARFTLTDGAQKAQLERGDYFVVVDGLSESNLAPNGIHQFINGPFGGTVPLLLATRPSEGFRIAAEEASHWLHVEPRRLDENSLPLFVKAYDPDATKLDPELLSACRGADGTYLPILVRLALLGRKHSDSDEPRTAVSLYFNAFKCLLENKGVDIAALLDWADEWSLRTYWRDGCRTLAFHQQSDQPNLEVLRNAGLLVETDDPGEVRFFHDSMQTYLTARALFSKYKTPPWNFLARSAGNVAVFGSAKSDIAGEAGSELFQMCCQVFRPQRALSDELRRQLLVWAAKYREDLSIRGVMDGVLPRLQDEVRGRVEPSSNSERHLTVAAQVCADDGLAATAELYSHIALLVGRVNPAEIEIVAP